MAKSRPAKVSLSQLRIIGGRWRGRKLQFAPLEGLRPTGDRLRETLFNWLQFYLPGARCLDLFAGSGALGLEALSRGASEVDFVELNPDAARMLKQQLALLEADNARVHQDSAAAFLARPAASYDIVFVDPPFAGDLWQQTLAALAPHLAEGALIYVETPRDKALSLTEDWRIEKEKRAGQVCMRLLSH
ncbi:16S rRNA (guanine(966)-N(2))-methyltransferase RsmD [Microbulbifer thermotolerans]|uniref:Ribosomal RNA small subunit methyltransferase D n=1 Tax=Microbulbifer thermotolerans TaxID=252514 RepID=A0A143HQ55_MICTH|nr:16S rRNA (guanine(966)-N(2))-methyltransferase RsmD [Microbulbifer thermotolerans]AMX03853.1 16S rRNA (guanine(966)-N(2))-methyltransferase RsmD [Microbulbifer thermotolerans]MCX2778644.1 16S rRNA (guanine(966)-N(2))-methyltransferase RsmD [Microbulbifer thermotolerans]MCX2783806.1 16S rRNA (guanine(966)-N(2))-methyltransferase RsmD [Microbulbifer thermotolerans]MCX2794114.1 16S rRNA (guanine(966)-N(2))-methyltransferase RsmD [Microbulbifer thermotolerans]MCX2803847.1 16S rRNA (guanine(966)